jgi:hypothetical protein
MFLLLSYVGVAGTAMWLVDKLLRLVDRMGDLAPVDRHRVFAFVQSRRRGEPFISFLFVTTGLGLIAKYIAGWNGPPGYFLEDVNLLCLIFFWVDFRLANDLGPRQGNPA